jgi:hypothetical protein
MEWYYIVGGLLAVSVAYNMMYPKKRGECSLKTARLEKLVPKYKDL